MTGLSVVLTEQSWGIYGPKISEPILFNTPEEALATLITHPKVWPDDVDFWLHLAADRGAGWNAVAYQSGGMKRPSWLSIYLLRLVPEIEVVAVNFWFLGRFIEALKKCGYRYLIIDSDGETKEGSICCGFGLRKSGFFCNDYLRDLVSMNVVLSRDFLVIDDRRVLQFIGLEPINEPAERKGFVYRKSHRWLP